MQVLVTEVTGKTGSIVYGKLQQEQDIRVMGLGRSPAKAREMFDSTADLFFGDITQPETIEAAFNNCQKLVILTSASPKMVAPPKPGERPEFEYPERGTPELVDYHGQKNQIDLALAAGIEHIVLVGQSHSAQSVARRDLAAIAACMGGTNENHPLNSMGNGKILIWKRKAEEYLVNSGINYTIIRAGGLLDLPGGKRKLLVGDRDELLNNPPPGVKTSIPRADVAETVVRALQEPAALNKAFDLISNSEADSQGQVTQDFAALFAPTTPASF